MYQRRSDLTLLSQFIPSLLFSGVTGAVRCTGDGSTDPNGGFFKGVELRCIGSVEDHINSITIYPVEDNALEVHFGSRVDDAAQGIWVYTGDSHSILQLAQFVSRTLGKTGFSSTIKTESGETLTLDPKAIRRAAMEEETLDYDPELHLYCSDRSRGAEAALDKAAELQRGFAPVNLSSPQFTFYERVFGDMSGGDVQNFRKNASGVTPFVIIYTPDENGVLTFRDYISTGKADSPPSKTMVFPVLEKYFRTHNSNKG